MPVYEGGSKIADGNDRRIFVSDIESEEYAKKNL